MAGLAAVTKRIQLFASCPVLAMPPAIVARMAATIDSIAPGRFGVNLVTGWQKAEYDQMGLWPGDEHYTPPLRPPERIRHGHAPALAAPGDPTSRAATSP